MGSVARLGQYDNALDLICADSHKVKLYLPLMTVQRIQIFKLLKDTFSSWLDDKGPKMAAALAYYTLFSLAPLLIIAIAVAGLFLSTETARGEVASGLAQLLGPSGAQAVQTLLTDTMKVYGINGGIIATIIGVCVLVWGAISVFTELQDSLNTIWKVDKKKTDGIRAYLMQSLLSISMVLGVGFLLIVSLILSTVVQSLIHHVGTIFGYDVGDLSSGSVWFWELINLGVSFFLITFIFAAIFKVLPNAVTRWRDVLLGGALTALLFVIGKTIVGVYLGRSGLTTAFGAAGSVIVILAWVYYTAQIFFLCAEFTFALANARNPQTLPAAPDAGAL